MSFIDDGEKGFPSSLLNLPGSAREPGGPRWLGRLSRIGVTAERMQGKSKGAFGAASTVKTLMAWSCACGWQGTSRDLNAGPDGLACPLCGGGLKAK